MHGLVTIFKDSTDLSRPNETAELIPGQLSFGRVGSDGVTSDLLVGPGSR